MSSEISFYTPLLYCAVICLFVARLLVCAILANELFSPTGLPLTGCFFCFTILSTTYTVIA